jgi:hypothetical protein
VLWKENCRFCDQAWDGGTGKASGVPGFEELEQPKIAVAEANAGSLERSFIAGLPAFLRVVSGLRVALGDDSVKGVSVAECRLLR